MLLPGIFLSLQEFVLSSHVMVTRKVVTNVIVKFVHRSTKLLAAFIKN